MEHHNTHCLSLSTISSHSYQFDSEGRIWQNSIVKDSKQILINKNYRIERNFSRQFKSFKVSIYNGLSDDNLRL